MSEFVGEFVVRRSSFVVRRSLFVVRRRRRRRRCRRRCRSLLVTFCGNLRWCVGRSRVEEVKYECHTRVHGREVTMSPPRHSVIIT